MSAPNTVKCRHGGHRVPAKEARGARRLGGTDHLRSHRWHHSTICVDCARKLLEQPTAGFQSISRWNVSDLIRAVE